VLTPQQHIGRDHDSLVENHAQRSPISVARINEPTSTNRNVRAFVRFRTKKHDSISFRRSMPSRSSTRRLPYLAEFQQRQV
jgi:hypothetical protein